MPVPNVFNKNFTASGDTEVIPSYGTNKKNRVMQLAIQNLDNSIDTRIEVKVAGDVVVGPLLLTSHALISIELPAWEDKPYFYIPGNEALVVNSSEDVELTVFGYADVA